MVRARERADRRRGAPERSSSRRAPSPRGRCPRGRSRGRGGRPEARRASCAPRRSRCRRFRSCEPATTCRTTSSRSPAPRITTRPSRSPPSGAPGARRGDGGRSRARRAGGPAARARPPQLLRATTPGCSLSAARAGGPPRVIACPSTRCSARVSPSMRRRRRSNRRLLGTGIDGCGIVTFSLTLERMARAFSRLESLAGGERVAAAMRAQPGPGRRPGRRRLPADDGRTGLVAKGGAEGLICAAGPDGTGVALKTEDGAARRTRAGPRRLPRPARRRPTRARAACRSSTRAASAWARSSPSVDKFFTNCAVLTSIRRAIEGGPGRAGRGSRSVVAVPLCNQLGREVTGTCSPSTSHFLTSKSYTSSSPKGKRKASSPTTRSSTGSKTSS